MSGTLVIGVGNALRRDDGAGVAAVRRLTRLVPAGVTVREASGEGTGLMALWAGAQRVLIADAVRSGGTPGALHRIDVTATRVPADFFHYSSHAFGLAEAVELSRALGDLPARLVIHGIEGADFSAGEGLSPPVAAGLDTMVARMAAELG